MATSQNIGMGARKLRDKARAHLATQEKSEQYDAQAAEIAELKAQMAAMMEKMGGDPDPDKRGPGRPRKYPKAEGVPA